MYITITKKLNFCKHCKKRKVVDPLMGICKGCYMAVKKSKEVPRETPKAKEVERERQEV